MLVLTRKENESIVIDGGQITLTVLRIRGNQISLGIQAPKEVSVLRAELKTRYPALYDRCQARRRFMVEDLGYQLSDEVLPLGNMPGAYFPCLLDTRRVCRHE